MIPRGLIADQIPVCYSSSTATAVLLAKPSQREPSVTPKAKSFLRLHWLEPLISLGIAGAASAGMPGTALQSEHLSLQGAIGHC